MRHTKVIVAIILPVILLSAVVLDLNWSKLFPTQQEPQPEWKPPTASDYAQYPVAMKIGNVSLSQNSILSGETLQFFVKVTYAVLVGGQPFDLNTIIDPQNMLARLDWNNFSVTINGLAAQFERQAMYPYVLCPVDIVPQINVTVAYRTDVVNTQFNMTRVAYTMSEVEDYINHNGITPIRNGNPFGTVQNIVDNYATIISGYILLQDHLDSLKANITSVQNWYNWLRYTFYNTNSSTDAINNFKNYFNSSGMEDLIKKIFTELHAIATSIDEYKTILANYPGAVKRALTQLALQNLEDPTQLLALLNTFNGMSSGDALYSAIQGTTKVMEGVYTQLAIELFDWITNVSYSSNYAYEHEQIPFYSSMASWYFDHLSNIQGQAYSVYGVTEFPLIIEGNMQFPNGGERGVGWWPADYYVEYQYSVGNWFVNTPFQSSDYPPSVFPRAQVRAVGLNNVVLGDFTVFIATESIVDGCLEKNGFHVQCLPPSNSDENEFPQFRAVAQYVASQVGDANHIFINDPVTANEIAALAEVFTNSQSVGDSMRVMQKYGTAAVFLEKINDEMWQLTG